MSKKSGSVALSDAARELKWRTESDLETLIRAQEIRDDPARHARAKKLAKERIADTQDVLAESTNQPKKGS
ncbi:hypothetical protein D9M73_73310 [compost metagenome]